MRFWRDHVLEHAGDHIDALKDHVKDQAKFAERCREIIADLGLPAEFEDPMEIRIRTILKPLMSPTNPSQSFLRKMLFWMMRQWRRRSRGRSVYDGYGLRYGYG